MSEGYCLTVAQKFNERTRCYTIVCVLLFTPLYVAGTFAQLLSVFFPAALVPLAICFGLAMLMTALSRLPKARFVLGHPDDENTFFGGLIVTNFVCAVISLGVALLFPDTRNDAALRIAVFLGGNVLLAPYHFWWSVEVALLALGFLDGFVTQIDVSRPLYIVVVCVLLLQLAVSVGVCIRVGYQRHDCMPVFFQFQIGFYFVAAALGKAVVFAHGYATLTGFLYGYYLFSLIGLGVAATVGVMYLIFLALAAGCRWCKEMRREMDSVRSETIQEMYKGYQQV